MEGRRLRLTRRGLLAGVGAWALAPNAARAFGQAGAFHARVLVAGTEALSGPRTTAPARWAWELVSRTSAPARLASASVRADEPKLLAEPFVIWAGSRDVQPLSAPELRGLSKFLSLGGMLLVDDNDPASGAFGRAARRELARIVPDAPPVRLDPAHVVYKTYYIIDRPVGRVMGAPHLEAIVRNKNAQVLFSSHDLLGALALTASGSWAIEVEPGGVRQREQALRLAVNIAMYLLCSDYKDDQVHAPWLMRRRAGRQREP